MRPSYNKLAFCKTLARNCRGSIFSGPGARDERTFSRAAKEALRPLALAALRCGRFGAVADPYPLERLS